MRGFMIDKYWNLFFTTFCLAMAYLCWYAGVNGLASYFHAFLAGLHCQEFFHKLMEEE